MMNLSSYAESQTQFLDALKPLQVAAGAAAFVISDAAQELFTIRSELAAAAVAKGLTGLVPLVAPGDVSNGLWQLPSDLKEESERWVQGMVAAMSVMSRAQQRLFELQVQLFSHRVQDAVKTLVKVNGALVSRRVSAQIISFADRRAASQAAAALEDASPLAADLDASDLKKKRAVG